MPITDTVSSIVTPELESLGVELVDIEHKGAVLRVVLDEPGGIGLDRLAEITRRLSKALDDADPISARYTLEVSSPGVERPLRTPRHFAAVVGQLITFKSRDAQGTRRVNGTLVAADEDGIVVAVEPDGASPAVIDPFDAPGVGPGSETFAYAQIDRARTVFVWGPAPKPGRGSKPGATRKSSARKIPVSAPAETSTSASQLPPAAAPLDNGELP